MSKKWWILIGVVLLVVGVGGWQFASGQGPSPGAQAAMETATVRKDTLAVVVEGTGSLTPRAEVSLALLTGGQVVEILVDEGQLVEAGQSLIRLETDELALQIARSEASLAAAKGQLAQLLAPSLPEEIAAQEANLAASEGQVSAMAANRDQIVAGPSEAEITASEVQVATAEMDYRTALRAYDSIDEDDKDKKEQARYDLWAAEVALEAARTQLDVLLAGADAAEVRAAQADVANVVAQRDAAQAQLDLTLAGAAEQEIQAAEASVARAQVTLDQVRLQLEQATLTAPMGGTVTALNVRVGEMTNPGQAVLVLSDLIALEVDINLDETDVAWVSLGQDARVSVDAFPGVEMAGEVTYIAPTANSASGVVLYPVTVRLASGEASVRAGMTADVAITTASQDNALIVPLRAVHVEDGRAYVERLVEGQIEQVQVALGLTTAVEAQVTGELTEGDVVVVVAGAEQDSDDRMMPGPGGGPMRFMGGN
ncbi:MAG: efflux RND transporter periplasmic adaptor subunit [Chloroflexi bacterium]|nr:efflux RND transporter periplasmic adaptor subunit [Chloroflexota bacterium]